MLPKETPLENVAAQEVVETPPSPTPDPAPESAQPSPAPAEATPSEYAPTYKFKVMDEEKEFDDFVRPIVNKENEAKIRELYEKAHGLDHIKPKYQETKQQYEMTRKELQDFQKGVQDIVAWREKDLGVFFEKLKVTPDKIYQWALEQLKREELPEDQKRVYNEAETLKRRNYELEQERLQFEERATTEAVQARQLELGQVLSSSDIGPLAEQYDARVGKPGSFYNLVVRHGQTEWMMSEGKRDLSPKEAVDEVVKMLGLSAQVPGQGATSNEPARTKVVTHNKPVVLPNVGSGNASPTGKTFRTLDELRKHAKEMAGK
jgi:hypothetical protein